jgi:hypothetical protein
VRRLTPRTIWRRPAGGVVLLAGVAVRGAACFEGCPARPRCVPGVSWQPGQAVAATRRPGREEIRGCDGSPTRSSTSVIVLPEREAREVGSATKAGGRRRERHSSVRPGGRERTLRTRCMNLAPYRGVKPWSRVCDDRRDARNGDVPGVSPTRRATRDDRVWPQRRIVLSFHTRPSRARPQPARAVTGTAALAAGASSWRSRPSPGASPARPRPVPCDGEAANSSSVRIPWVSVRHRHDRITEGARSHRPVTGESPRCSLGRHGASFEQRGRIARSRRMASGRLAPSVNTPALPRFPGRASPLPLGPRPCEVCGIRN